MAPVKYLLLIQLLCVALSVSKIVTCAPHLSQNLKRKWSYCTKMAFKRDEVASVTAMASFIEDDGKKEERPKYVSLLVFTESQWEKVMRDEELAEGRVACAKMVP